MPHPGKDSKTHAGKLDHRIDRSSYHVSPVPGYGGSLANGLDYIVNSGGLQEEKQEANDHSSIANSSSATLDLVKLVRFLPQQ